MRVRIEFIGLWTDGAAPALEKKETGDLFDMNAKQLTDSLDRFGQMLPHIVAGVRPSDAQWKPADGACEVSTFATGF